MPDRAQSTQICPHCGASFQKGKLACPECGSDESTGWQDPEEIAYRSVDIPDVFGQEETAFKDWIPRKAFVAIALLLVLVMLLFLLF